MENHTAKLPVYVKFSQITVGIVAFFYILYLGQGILVPLTFALLISILLNPVVNFCVKKGMTKIIAISLCLTFLVLFVSAILFFIGSQITLFSDSLPQLRQKFDLLLDDLISWGAHSFQVSKVKLDSWVISKKIDTINETERMIARSLNTISGFFLLVLLIPVYIFLFLLYKPLLLDFVSRIFKKERHIAVAEVLISTKALIQSYLIGLLIEMAIMATLNSSALLIIGVDYAILFGIIGSLLNLIPYIGGIIAISLPMLMAFLTQTPLKAFMVLVFYIIIQIIDNNYLVPKIVASKVKINALVSIVVILIGGGLWGIAGMFLSIPVTGIAKVIFDKIPNLKPLGLLIGDSMPAADHSILNIQTVKQSKKDKLK